MDGHTQGETNVTVSAIIVRACSVCGGARQQDVSCVNCGNTEPAQVHDLGVVAKYDKNPVEQLKWKLFGQPAAARRARQANKEIANADDS